MEVCVHIKTSLCEELSCNRGSVTGPRNPSQRGSRNLSANDLERCLTQYLNIEDNKISTSGCDLKPTKNTTVNLAREDECKYLDESTSSDSAFEKCISKCATFPPLGEPKSTVGGSSSVQKKLEDSKATEVSITDECAESAIQCDSCSVSLPTPMKPVSAMKGSREKQGVEPKKLSVTWAPDVYDPVPTSVSHVPSYKHHRLRHRSDSKKYAKSKHKSSSSKSSRSKSKDKKQPRKSSGCSTSKLKPLQYINGVAGFGEFEMGMLDYNEASLDLDPDPFCENSFLKNSVSKLQFTAA